MKVHTKNVSRFEKLGYRSEYRADLEEVDGGSGVNAGLLVDGGNDGALLVLDRVEGGQKVQLEASGDLVLELDLGSEDVRGGPSLSDGDAVLGVNPFPLDITGYGARLGVTETGNLEAGGERGSLNLERSAVDGVVLEQEIRGAKESEIDQLCRIRRETCRSFSRTLASCPDPCRPLGRGKSGSRTLC